jgi:hypothetical protein
VVAGDDQFAERVVSWLSRPWSLGVLCGI